MVMINISVDVVCYDLTFLTMLRFMLLRLIPVAVVSIAIHNISVFHFLTVMITW